MTLDEFKRQAAAEGLHVVVVPHLGCTHLETKTKAIRKTYPAEPGWPEGRAVTTVGREVIPVEIVDGKRVAKMKLDDFKAFKSRSRDPIGWERENPELSVLASKVGNASTNQGPGYTR